MSSIDPALASAQALLQAVDTALADATLNLGASGAEIAAQLQVGDLFPAIVLAPQGGTDLLQIFGQTVAAQLPPGIHPGETIVLQVNGFDGNRILVSNLGVADPNDPPNLAQVVVPQPASTEPRTVATLTTVPQPADVPEQRAQPTAPVRVQTQSPPTPQPPQPPTAPPREVFVAASVRQAQPSPPSDAPILDVIVEPAQPGTDIEARMAAIRTAPAAPPQSTIPGRGVPPATTPAPLAPGVRAQPSVPLAALLTPQVKISQAARQSAPEAAAQTAIGDAATKLLARIRVLSTPFALAAARVANEAVASIPRAFARLEAALPRDLPVAALPLRTLLAFVSKFDLTSTRALPEQIAAFVSHVVDGPEPKLAQALAAFKTADAAVAQKASADPLPPAGGEAGARAVERAAAVDFDLKSAVAALAQSLPSDASPQLSRALTDVLTVTTGAQFAALSNAATDPNAISIALPAFFHDGGRPAQMRVERDAPGGRQRLDADNFRIGFVLDTATLGTLAINVETVGRTVRVDVRTERASATDRITGTLADLRSRFEHLRYRVAAMTAGMVAPRPIPSFEPAPVEPEPVDDTPNAASVDLQA